MGEANRRKARDDARSRRDAITEYELRQLFGDPSRETEYKEKLASYTALKEREAAELLAEERGRVKPVTAAALIEATGIGYPYVHPEPQGFKGKKNLYVCDTCEGHIVTVDVDEGVTPFMMNCQGADGLLCKEACKGYMRSAMYRVPQDIKPSHEWYYPQDLREVKPNLMDHVTNGGLLFRKASQ